MRQPKKSGKAAPSRLTTSTASASVSTDLPAPSLPPVIQLRPYQRRWIDDGARFKGAVKSARIGFSFGTGIEAILDSLAHPTTWTVLSASKAQSIEFVEQAQKNIQAIGAIAQAF